MLRDVFYYGAKPNVHPREQYAESLDDARQKCTTEHFWIINEFCDYKGFDWDFDFEFLPDEDVWAEQHTNIWPSQHQKDSGTWLCSCEQYDLNLLIYRNDVETVKRKNIKNECWVEVDRIDHSKFDFSWHPDPTSIPYIYKWGSKFAPVELKSCLEYHVEGATDVKYMTSIVELLPDTDRWIEHQSIDKTKFDMSWRPDPMDPPLNYIWGNKYIDGILKPTLEYRVPDAVDTKYMPDLITVLPEWDKWVEVQAVDKTKFDFSWRPDPREPAYIYVWGNKYIDAELKATLEYHCPDATERKYMTNDVVVLPESNRWVEVQAINKAKFDMSWRPDPREPAYIYTWGNKYIDGSLKPTLEYHCDNATERKYMPELLSVLPESNRWVEVQDVDKSKFDFSWRPDPREPAYIYTWGNKYIDAEFRPTLEYQCEGATEVKYMTNDVVVLPEWNKWKLLDKVDITSFDFSWRPDPREPDLIYVFGNDLYDGTVMPTVEYHCDNATERKYISDIKVKLLPDKSLFEHLEDATGIDYAWRPDPTSPPYIYAWGNQWNKPEDKISIQYVVSGATEYKYMDERATRLPSLINWQIRKDVDVSKFDFSWEPSPADEPYIYEFGTQWQKTGGPRYVVKGATSVKYVENSTAISLPNSKSFVTMRGMKIKSFDYSWHPDSTEHPYIYVFGNKWYSAEVEPTIEYRMPGAVEKKYIDTIIADLEPDYENWITPDNIDISNVDYTWHPHPGSPPYIYQFGTQWQKTGGPRYLVDNATERKFIDDIKVTRKPTHTNWTIPDNIDTNSFDFSWHPDDTDPAYIYVFGTQWASSGGPVYTVHGATETKYVDVQVATAKPTKDKWKYDPTVVDESKFDFSWHPDPREPAYIYVWGNKYEDGKYKSTIEYHADGATDIKYMTNDVIVLPEWNKWVEVQAVDKTVFDFTWRPDPLEPPYIYTWGNKHIDGILKPTLEYHCDNATERKYMTNDIVVLPEDDKWVLLKDIDKSSFDFTWRPDPREPAYIYTWGNKFEPVEISPTLEYHCENATEVKYMSESVNMLPQLDRWVEVQAIDKTKFDFSWRPDPREPAYIYVWGNKYIDGSLKPTLEYHCPDATERKYMTNDVIVLPEDDKWVEVQAIDKTKFDMSWRPDPREPAYIYVWGNKYIDAELQATLEYHCKDATERKYMSNDVVVLPEYDKWSEVKIIDKTKFDMSWRPNPREPAYIYVWGNKYEPAEVSPTLQYKCFGATEIKYMDELVDVLPEWDKWVFLKDVDKTKFDFSWRPDPLEPPYIYTWGNKYIDAELEPTLEYRCENATERKYMTNDIVVLPEYDRWLEVQKVDKTKFDMAWRPDPREPAYIYVWGNKYIDGKYESTLEYIVPEATERKYMSELVDVLPQWDRWVLLKDVDKTKFDFSWRPDPLEPPYIYTWGNKYEPAEITPTLQYRCPNAIEIKYMSNDIGVLPEWDRWVLLKDVDKTKFDFSWRPDPLEPPYIYTWGNKYEPAEITPTLQYKCIGATEIKYMSEVAPVLPEWNKWEIPTGVNKSTFDFTWRPDPLEPPYIYQFGTLEDANDGPRYISSSNNGEVVKLKWIFKENAEQETVVSQYYIETTLDDLVKQHPDELFWAKHKNIDYSSFDFDWRPEMVEISYQLDYVHVFGSPESELTQTYFVSGKNYLAGKTSFNFIEIDTKLDDKTLFKIFKKSDMFYVDKGNSESQARFDRLKALHPQIQKTRYLNSWVDTIKRCANRATSDLIWVLNSELDYNNFDFEYYPNPWQMNMVHVFGTQWSHWGSTFLVNRETFAEDTKYINIIEHLSNINFVKTIRAKATQTVYDTIIIDHGNKELDTVVKQVTDKTSGKNVTVVKYNNSYLQTLKDIVTRLQDKKEHYLWLCSSVCDYSSFDFSYTVDPFARDNLHVFPSGKQKFGDTFFIDVNKTKEIIDDMLLLEDYHKVNYNGTMKANRLPEPIIVTSNDTLIDAAINIEGFPYATIISSDNKNISVIENEPMNLWAPETKTIMVTSTGATRITVPREVKDHVKKELYDYPYIKKTTKLAISSPMDIVYLSNGETGAEENWEHLQKITQGLKNRVVRVDGVNGRVQAYHAALEASETPWAFTVFAKLKISPKFDFNWQPDRMQVAKHYVFHAKNPVNGLIYGHQAMIAYNKKLTLANKGTGLDFTLDDEHEVVPLLSGVANYNTDEFSTWRTAFREVLKLKAEDSEVARQRLDAWLNKATGDYFQYSIKGAIDADEYYDEVDGDFNMLKLSYEWAWLKERFANS